MNVDPQRWFLLTNSVPDPVFFRIQIRIFFLSPDPAWPKIWIRSGKIRISEKTSQNLSYCTEQ